MDQNYKPNSHKSKAEEAVTKSEKKEITKVISGNARVKKKTGVDKFVGNLIADDVRNIKSYVINDVLIPTIKNAIFDIITNGAEMSIYGERGRHRRSGSSNARRVDYGKYYDKPRSERHNDNQTKSGYSYDDVMLDTRADAEDVLERMSEIIDVYDSVKVADFYDLVGVRSQYTDQKYGWEDLRSAEVIRTRDGYMIKFPRVMPLK